MSNRVEIRNEPYDGPEIEIQAQIGDDQSYASYEAHGKDGNLTAFRVDSNGDDEFLGEVDKQFNLLLDETLNDGGMLIEAHDMTDMVVGAILAELFGPMLDSISEADLEKLPPQHREALRHLMGQDDDSDEDPYWNDGYGFGV